MSLSVIILKSLCLWEGLWGVGQSCLTIWHTLLEKLLAPLMLQPHHPCCEPLTHTCIFMHKYIKREAAHSVQTANTLQCLTTLVYLTNVGQRVGALREKTNSVQVDSRLLYLAQMFDCHSECLCNLASHLKGSSSNAYSSNANKTKIHHMVNDKWTVLI